MGFLGVGVEAVFFPAEEDQDAAADEGDDDTDFHSGEELEFGWFSVLDFAAGEALGDSGERWSRGVGCAAAADGGGMVMAMGAEAST